MAARKMKPEDAREPTGREDGAGAGVDRAPGSGRQETARDETSAADAAFAGVDATNPAGGDPGGANPDSAAQSGGAASQSGGAALREQLEAARAERDVHRESWLRTQAELENYRRRVQRELDETRRYQAAALARDVLPVLDNLRRAISAAEETGDAAGLIDGVRLVLKQLEDTLTRHEVTPIPAVGQPFDPNLHEALQQVPSAEHPPMTVVHEHQRGYRLHDRVLRPSQVVVSGGS